MPNIEKTNKDKQKLLDAAAAQWVELVLQQISFRKNHSKINQSFPYRNKEFYYGKSTK